VETADQVALGQAFAQELTAGERLSYTLAIHAGLDADGRSHNPHAHVMISERQHDGHERSRKQWFRRADSVHPERGGAPKTRSLHGHAWMEQAREGWASLTNAALARAGHDVRVDHRSYERQGIDREPGQHFGPAAAHMVHRAEAHDRLEGIATAAIDQERLQAVDQAIASLEAVRETWLREDEPRTQGGGTQGYGGSIETAAARDDDSYPGRCRWRMRSTCFVHNTRPPRRSGRASKRSKRP
jgi:hypothetical protein